MQTNTPAKANKTKPKNTKPRKEQVLLIEEQHQPLVADAEANIASIVRKGTEATYLTAHYIARVKDVLPEKTFGKWVKERCGYTSRMGRHFVAIDVNLQGPRERLIAAGVAPTVLYVLSSARPEQIEAVLAEYESGRRPTVSQIKDLTRGDAPKKEPVELGGAAGLRRAIDARIKVDLGVFETLVKRSLKAVEQIVADIAKGKHIPKTRLATDVETDCQKAAILLGGVISPRGSDAPLSVEWETVRRVIAVLGDSPRYPAREEFVAWVVEKVRPALRFVVLGEAFADSASAAVPVAADSADDVADVSQEHGVDDAGSTAQAPVGEREQVSEARFIMAPPLVPDEAVLLAEASELPFAPTNQAAANA